MTYWWSKYDDAVLEDIGKEYWKLYIRLVDKAWTYKPGSKEFWVTEELSLKLLTPWLEICHKLNKPIR